MLTAFTVCRNELLFISTTLVSKDYTESFVDKVLTNVFCNKS